MKLNKFLAKLITGLSVFICAILISLVAYSYAKRNNPILYRSETQNFDEFYSDVFIQNPFRDKTKEIAADSFLNSIKGKTISESFVNRKIMLNSYQDCGNGKLVKWKLWNRLDGENETEFRYAVTRELSSKIFHLSFVVLKLTRENSDWNVTGYVCKGTSNETWKGWKLFN